MNYLYTFLHTEALLFMEHMIIQMQSFASLGLLVFCQKYYFKSKSRKCTDDGRKQLKDGEL